MTPGTPVHAYKFQFLDIWVQIHNLPIDYLTTKIIGNLLDGLGVLYPIDPIASTS